MKKFLKRFEKLEGTKPYFGREAGNCLTTKRFERLEINERTFEFSLRDTVTTTERQTEGRKKFFIICPYCGRENDSNAPECSYCKQKLQTDFVADYQSRAQQMISCACGAVNLKDRRFCWVCGKELAQAGASAGTNNVITLTIDGVTYSSADPHLPADVRELVNRIRQEGYSKELVDSWIREKNERQTLRRQEIEQDIQRREARIMLQVISAVGAVLLLLLRGCLFHH